MVQTLVPFDENLPAWEQAFYAFLAEKERRSGSMRTVDAYSRMLQRFFGTLGKTPEQVTGPDVFSFAHGIGPSGRKPASITIDPTWTSMNHGWLQPRLATWSAAAIPLVRLQDSQRRLASPPPLHGAVRHALQPVS